MKSLRQTWSVQLVAVVLFGTLLTATAAAQAVSSAVNISTRMKVETGDNVLIGGFIIAAHVVPVVVKNGRDT